MTILEFIGAYRGSVSLILFFLIYFICHIPKINGILGKLYNKINVNALAFSLIVITLFNLITKRIEKDGALSYIEVGLGITIMALVFNMLFQAKRIKED